MARKSLIPLVVASVLLPAAAKAEDAPTARALHNHSERSGQRNDNSDNRTSRSQAVERRDRSASDRTLEVERAPREGRAARGEVVQRVERNDDTDRDVRRHQRVRRAGRDVRQGDAIRREDRSAEQVDQVQVDEPVRPTPVERRREDPAGASPVVGREPADARIGDNSGNRDRRVWRRDGDGSHDGRDVRNGRDWRRDRDGDRDGDRRWDRDWRRDGRYDWSRYRHRYGSLYRLGRYYDPYGWRYRRFSIGFSLWPSYYGSSFWLNDPWHYRLPPAYGPYRWVRYYDDALLVNIYTGHVLDVVHNIFW